MAISDKTRKLLWGRSGNRCAFCRAVLTMDATHADAESVVGDECHIISGQANGPRADASYPRDRIDSYENLVLLCRTHHKLVDDQWRTFTAEVLRKLKQDHEAFVLVALDRPEITKAESVLEQQLRDARMERCGPVLTAVDDELALLRSWRLWLGNRNYLQLVCVRQESFEQPSFVTAVEQARKVSPSVYGALKQAGVELNMLQHAINDLQAAFQAHVATPVLVRLDKSDEFLHSSTCALEFAERAATELEHARAELQVYLQS